MECSRSVRPRAYRRHSFRGRQPVTPFTVQQVFGSAQHSPLEQHSVPWAQHRGLPATGAHPFSPSPHGSQVPLAASVHVHPSAQQVVPQARSGVQQAPPTHGPLQHWPLQQVEKPPGQH